MTPQARFLAQGKARQALAERIVRKEPQRRAALPAQTITEVENVSEPQTAGKKDKKKEGAVRQRTSNLQVEFPEISEQVDVYVASKGGRVPITFAKDAVRQEIHRSVMANWAHRRGELQEGESVVGRIIAEALA